MLTVRFPLAMIRAVRAFARQDHLTVSAWIRKLIDAELKNPQRSRAVFADEWPRSETVSSGQGVRIELLTGGPPETATF